MAGKSSKEKATMAIAIGVPKDERHLSITIDKHKVDGKEQKLYTFSEFSPTGKDTKESFTDIESFIEALEKHIGDNDAISKKSKDDTEED